MSSFVETTPSGIDIPMEVPGSHMDVKPEYLQEIKQEPDEENNDEVLHCYVRKEEDDAYESEASPIPVQVSSVWSFSTDFCNNRFAVHLCLTVSSVAYLFCRFLAVTSLVALFAGLRQLLMHSLSCAH